MTRQSWIIAIVLMAIVAGVGASSFQYDGAVRPIDARFDLILSGSGSWYVPPTLSSREGDPTGVYVVVPALPHGQLFDAVRIDSRSVQQSRTGVTLGPQSPFRSFMPAAVHLRVAGVRFARPAFHLFSFPDGGGPGIHRVDSVTGRIDVMSGKRVLFTRNVFNSSNTAEMLSLITADREQRWVAAIARTDGGWRLFLFERREAPEHAANLVEES